MNGEENMERADETPFLNNLKNENNFKVPDGYFENLLQQTLSRKNIQDQLSNNELFRTPANYFEELETNILNVIKINNLDNSNSAFKVPDHYFESSAKSIISKTREERKTPIFNLNLIKYAAAACVLIATSLSLYFNMNESQTVSNKISNLPKEEIVNYLQLHSETNDVTVIIENLEDVSLLEEEMASELAN